MEEEGSTEETKKLSEDEVALLKELARNLSAMDRVKRIATSALLWLAGIVGAGVLLWDTFFSKWLIKAH